jgi:hypothetical protein
MYISQRDGEGPLTTALLVVAFAVLIGCAATIAGWGFGSLRDESSAGYVDGGDRPAEGARQLGMGVRSD